MKKFINKKLIIILLFILFLILIFISLNTNLKKVKNKSYLESLNTTLSIDIIINSPYQSSNTLKTSKTLTKDELKEIITLLKEVSLTEEVDNNFFNDDHYSYTLFLKNEDNLNNINIFVKDNNITINGKIAKLDNIEVLNKYIIDNIPGYGALTCQTETDTNTLIEKYYFKDNTLYYYSKRQTFLPKDIDILDNNIIKYNSYEGVSAKGNKIGNNKYSYFINIDLSLISNENLKEIVKEDKNSFLKKNKEDIIQDKKDMTCNFSFI